MKTVNVIIGPPGTGKTTRIAEEVSRRVGDMETPWGREPGASPVMVCSLTRAAAAECAGRDLPISRNAVGTLHSFAFRALQGPALTVGRMGEFGGWEFSDDTGDGEDFRPEPPASQREGDVLLARYDVIRHRREKVEGPALQEFVQQYEAWKAENNLLDFTDLIEQAISEPPPGSPRHMLLDEAQDLSRLELDLARTWATYCESITICGDPRQSLYCWRGAYPAMFADPRIRESREVLSQSYRVPRAVHQLAGEWARQLTDWEHQEYHPTAAEGNVVGLRGTSWKRPETLLPVIEHYIAEGATVMVQTSCSYMLQPLVKLLRAEGIPFHNPRRRSRGDWNPLRRSSRGATTLQRAEALISGMVDGWTGEAARQWLEVTKGILKRGYKQRLADVLPDTPFEVAGTLLDILDLVAWDELDRLANLETDAAALVRWWADRTETDRARMADYIAKIVERFGEAGITDDPQVMVGTIHSFKGSEADVCITFPDLSGAGQRSFEGDDDEHDEVIRLGYVALTRAKDTIAIAEPVTTSMCMPLWDYL